METAREQRKNVVGLVAKKLIIPMHSGTSENASFQARWRFNLKIVLGKV